MLVYTPTHSEVSTIPTTFFLDTEDMMPKFIWKHKKLQVDHDILKIKSKAGGITALDLRTHIRAVVIKTVFYWYRNREDQRNRIETP